jgi:hypothetical protein
MEGSSEFSASSGDSRNQHRDKNHGKRLNAKETSERNGKIQKRNTVPDRQTEKDAGLVQ